VFLVLLGIGIWARKSNKAVGFYTGTKPPEVTDVRKYNRAVAILWFVYAGLFELLALPFLFLKQNAAGFLWVVLGTVAITIALMIVYNRILRKYEQKK
jgi:predicted membrane channel-forming protein YqfA (hemolysin III family)